MKFLLLENGCRGQGGEFWKTVGDDDALNLGLFPMGRNRSRSVGPCIGPCRQIYLFGDHG